MAYKSKTGYRLTVTIDEEYYNYLCHKAEEMIVTDNQAAKIIIVTKLKELMQKEGYEIQLKNEKNKKFMEKIIRDKKK